MDDFTALRLQIEWGADEALEAEPVDRLRAVTDPISLTPPPNALPQGEAEKAHLTIPAPFHSKHCVLLLPALTVARCAIPPATWSLPRAIRPAACC
jgi:hypothetical protein